MKKLIPLFVLFVLFAGCKKEEKTYDVIYKIAVDGNTGGYVVRYTLPDGSTGSKGTLTDQLWISTKYTGYKKGFPISLTLETNGGDYSMLIYVDGSLAKQRYAGAGSSVLETHTPY